MLWDYLRILVDELFLEGKWVLHQNGEVIPLTSRSPSPGRISKDLSGVDYYTLLSLSRVGPTKMEVTLEGLYPGPSLDLLLQPLELSWPTPNLHLFREWLLEAHDVCDSLHVNHNPRDFPSPFGMGPLYTLKDTPLDFIDDFTRLPLNPGEVALVQGDGNSVDVACRLVADYCSRYRLKTHLFMDECLGISKEAPHRRNNPAPGVVAKLSQFYPIQLYGGVKVHHESCYPPDKCHPSPDIFLFVENEAQPFEEKWVFDRAEMCKARVVWVRRGSHPLISFDASLMLATEAPPPDNDAYGNIIHVDFARGLHKNDGFRLMPFKKSR